MKCAIVFGSAIAVLWLGVALAADPVVATRTLPVGTIIVESDYTRSDAVSENSPSVVGQEVKRAIYAGRPISQVDLGPRTLIHRNEVVTILHKYGPLWMRTMGRALGSGGAGETIDVMNLDSRTSIRVMVLNVGLVGTRR